MNEGELFLVKGALGLAAAAVTYALVVRRLADIAQPYRLELAALGERIIAEGSSTDSRDQARFYLDHAFSGWVAVAAVVLVPFASLWTLATFWRRGPQKVRASREDDRAAILFLGSIFVANPIFGTLMMIEFFLFGLILSLAGGTAAVMSAVDALVRAEIVIPTYRQRFGAA